MTINSLYNEQLLKGDYHAEVKAYYFREWMGYEMRTPHTHDQIEIMYVLSGNCVVEVMELPIKLKKGEFILLDADIPHRLTTDREAPCRMLNIEFAFKERTNIFPSMKDLAGSVCSVSSMLRLKQPYFLLRDPDEVHQVLKGLIMELSDKEEKSEFSIQLLLAEMLIKISRLAGQNNEGSAAANLHINRALHYINNNYDKDLHARDIASHISVNEGYLQRIFKLHNGYTIVEYLTIIRLEKAKMLLAHTDISIIDISGYVGINSRQYFSYIFKKNTGITPAQYRKSVEVKYQEMQNAQG